MTRFRNFVRPVILSTLILVTGAVGDARANCDEDCPFNPGGYFEDCLQDDLGPGRCMYSDDHYYATMDGC